MKFPINDENFIQYCCFNQRSNMPNKYQEIYSQRQVPISEITNQKEAEKIATQLGFMYNALGLIIKDIIKLLAIKYSNPEKEGYVKSKPLSNEKEINLKNYDFQSKQPKTLLFDEKMRINEKKNMQSKVSQKREHPPVLKEESRRAETKKEGICFGNYEFQNPLSGKNAERHEKIERVTGVRGKRERQSLNGYTCPECQKFYSLVGEDLGEDACNCASRHRSNLPPTKYFSGFTQEFGFDD